MTSLDQIILPIETELTTFKSKYKESLEGDNSSKKDFLGYILKMEGKGIRPILLFLSAHLNGGVTEKSYYSAVIMELTHSASLIHDDIVDEAFQRRGRWSINALWRSKKAVLIGDYVFARAISTASKYNLNDVLGDISSVIEDMSMGEIEQSDASLRLDINETIYFEVIRCKTASLMSCSARIGVMSVDGGSEKYELMRRFGELLGLIFQIKDDILDYTGGASGKMVGNDLKEQKITLPLLYAMKRAEQKERNTVLKLLREKSEKKNYIDKIFSFVKEKGGIEASEKRMRQLAQEAVDILNVYPDSIYKKSLVDLVWYICDRNK